MGRTRTFTAWLVALAALAAQPAGAQDAGSEAEALRQLDIMLMVTSLRCRFGEADFRADYNRFAAQHLAIMNQAGEELRLAYAGRRLDALQTGIANRYGTGHPWLDCAGLQQVTRNLAEAEGRQVLLAAADELLGDAPARSGLVASYVP